MYAVDPAYSDVLQPFFFMSFNKELAGAHICSVLLKGLACQNKFIIVAGFQECLN